jgi:pimeloyl-ACP methyl ester carboxylesterase
VCLHGTLDRGGSFARVARRLPSFDVVTYDRRGYQGSRQLSPLGLAFDVADVTKIIERETGPVMVFGHSYGGVVAIAAALALPDLVSSLVLYETPMSWLESPPTRSEETIADPEAAAELFFQRVVSPAAWDRLTDTEKQSRRDDGAALLCDMRTARGPAPIDLRALSRPWTYAHGDGPRHAHYQQLFQSIRALSPRVRDHELHRAGHGAHLANPDQTASLLTAVWNTEHA